MSLQSRTPVFAITLALSMLMAPSTVLRAQGQVKPAPRPGTDSITVIPGIDFEAGSLHRRLLGDNYRDLWTTPIKVAVLDLASFGGGIKPTKLGGGRQTRSLRFIADDKTEFVFRPVFKTGTILPESYNGTVLRSIFTDQGSASHPTATVVAPPMFAVLGLIHPSPRLVVMPDDARLGEFQQEFAGKLGTIEEYPVSGASVGTFGNATEILDAIELLALINKSPSEQIDSRALLRARLVDLLLNDNDRHPGQWRWAKLNGTWKPIPRDRDKVFLSYEGLLLDIARIGVHALVKFDDTYPNPAALFENAGEFDRRMLGGLDKSAWDAAVSDVQRAITDNVIRQSLALMPREYAASSSRIAQRLIARRAALPMAASRYYTQLASVVEINGTDAPDKAVINRAGEGVVDVSIHSGNSAPWYSRRFKSDETREIRVYLHDGDDSAVVTGAAQLSISVKVIGGNGTNVISDVSTVGGKRGTAGLYDVGSISGVRYDRDSVAMKKDEASELDQYYNRRPWLRAYGTSIPPQHDRGSSIKPTLGFRSGHGIGLVPRVGVTRTTYAFRHVPYSTSMGGDIGYSVVHRGYAANLFFDKRLEESDVHIPVTASVSQLDVIEFRGFGNDVPENDDEFYNVRQTAWQFRPAIGKSFNRVSDITLAPVVRYTTTDSIADRYISQARPYGVGTFAQAGIQLKLHYDTRYLPDSMKPRVVLDVGASEYPGLWDAATAYQSVEGAATTFINFPFATRPVLALRAGAKKLFGNFPYFDAAFLGGGSTLRTEHRQRFAGDASLFGSSELRVPVAKFPLILPLDVGLLGFGEAGRVYIDGDSEGGWHTAIGAGFWVGIIDPGKSVNVLITNKKSRRVMISLGFAY